MEENVKKSTIEELRYDSHNFNRHTEFGMQTLEKSLREFGFGRSIVVDKHNNIIGGNGMVETAGNIGMVNTKVIESDGKELIVVKRIDIDINTKQGREMALADNATASADLSWDADELQKAEDEFDINYKDWGVEINELAPDDEDEEKDNGGGISVKIEFQSELDKQTFMIRYKDEIKMCFNCTIK